MNILKKNIKWIVLIVMGIVISSGVSIYATSNYLATQVNYTRNNTTISVSNALDQLYAMKDNKYTQEEYNNNYTNGYNAGRNDNTAYIKTGVTLSHTGSTLSYYELGFRPSFVFIMYNNNFYCSGFNGDTHLYWGITVDRDNIDDVQVWDNSFNTDTNGFYYSINGSGTWNDCTIYAIK